MPSSQRRLTMYLVIGLLLSALTMGNILWCNPIIVEGPPNMLDTLHVQVEAGQPARDVSSSIFDDFRFALCPADQVSGVYPHTRRRDVFVSVDLMTSPDTPVGRHCLTYRQTYDFAIGANFDQGYIDLTVTAPTLVACFYALAEFIPANQPIQYSAVCSQGDITEYRWWFDYNDDPLSAPTTITTVPSATGTMPAGQRTVRLVVRTATSQQAETQHVYQVGGL